MFTITSIEIYPECQHRKNLRPDTYNLSEGKIKDFFGRNISLHVLVGKNGSGKSSLLDLVLRMINNVGAIMCKNLKRQAEEPLSFVTGIFADLHYIKEENRERHEAVLCIRNTAMWLKYDRDIYWLCDNLLCPTASFTNLPRYDNEYSKSKENWSNLQSVSDFQKIADKFFFTIATNFSMYGYLSIDYQEDCLSFDPVVYLLKNGQRYITADHKPLSVKNWVKKKDWIDRLFPKNDVYLCPVVLNPYRNHDKIDVGREYSLTVNRLASLLLKCNNILEGYELDKLEYSLDMDFYTKFTPIFKSEEEKINLLENGGVWRKFAECAPNGATMANVIMKGIEDELNCPLLQGNENFQDIEWYARLYVSYQLLYIAGTYPQYNEYANLGDINRLFENRTVKVGETPKIHKLITKAGSSHSHVELAFHQTLNFIRRLEQLKKKGKKLDLVWMNHRFDYSTYQKEILHGVKQNLLDDYMENMPPNIFKQSILLKRKVNIGDGISYEKGIPFNQLSSGEKQFILQMTTLVYHLQSLKSETEDAVRYRDVNIILDEIEVCFHPDYQRQFVSKLLNLLIEELKLNDSLNIHIWMTTHSPFVLSDIPTEYITSMSEGKIAQGISLGRTFCANIYDLLHSKFFMNDYIGEFAKKKLNSLITAINESEKEQLEPKYPDLRLQIDMIGDMFIREKLLEQLDEKCPNIKRLNQQLVEAKAKVKEIEQRIKQKTKKENDQN